MIKKLTISVIFTVSVAVGCYLRYVPSKPTAPTLVVTHDLTEQPAQELAIADDLDLDLSSIDPIEDLAETVLPTPTEETMVQHEPLEKVQEEASELAKHESNDALSDEKLLEMLSEQDEEPTTKSVDSTTAVPTPAPQKVATAEQPSATQQEKMEAFQKNMENLQQQASAEWERMTPEERVEAEEQVEVFQHNFQQEVDRLSKLTPEEVEFERTQAMAKLERENPEAYQQIKSLEEMFMGMADATE